MLLGAGAGGGAPPVPEPEEGVDIVAEEYHSELEDLKSEDGGDDQEKNASRKLWRWK